MKEQNGRGRVQKEVVPTGTSVPEGVKTTVVLLAKRGRTQDSECHSYLVDKHRKSSFMHTFVLKLTFTNQVSPSEVANSIAKVKTRKSRL